MKKIIAVALALALSVSMLAGCGSSGSASASQTADGQASASETQTASNGDLTEFKLMYVTWIGCGPLFIAKEKGFFEKYGLNPEFVLNEDESQTASMMVSNSVQASSCVLDKVVTDYGSGTGQKVAFVEDESTGGDGVIASADIQSVSDLKGKKVGIDTASTEYYFFNLVLEDNGMTMDDVQIVDMDASSAGTSFISGELDAAVVWEPWLTNASQREGGHVLVSSKEYPDAIMDTMTLSKQFYADHPEAVDALRQAWYDAVDYYNNNHDDAVAIMAKGLDLTTEDIEGMLPGVTFMGKTENESFLNKDSASNIYDVAASMAKFLGDAGRVDKDLDTTDLFVD